MKIEEWRAMGKQLFGEHGRDWRFKCPSCGGIQTPADFVARGETPEEASRIAPQECIKRKAALARGRRELRPGECDWTAYGLFRGPVILTADGGTEIPVFEFAPPHECHHWDGDGREAPCQGSGDN